VLRADVECEKILIISAEIKIMQHSARDIGLSLTPAPTPNELTKYTHTRSLAHIRQLIEHSLTTTFGYVMKIHTPS
jgi:hypothetical protein